MSKTVTKTVYTFKELTEMKAPGVESARQWLSEGATDGAWWEYVYEMWQTALNQIGFTDPEISFSGFSCQGDGACFTSGINVERLVGFMSADIEPENCIAGDPEDFRPWVAFNANVPTDKRYLRLAWVAEYIDAKVERTSSHYCHSLTCRAVVDLHDKAHRDWYYQKVYRSSTPKLRELFNEFEKDVETLRERLCHAIYKSLQEEYDDITSDENLTDFAEGNDYTFTINGTREG